MPDPVALEDAVDRSLLSPSLNSILSAQTEPVDAVWLAQEILRTHDYAKGRAKDIAGSSVAWPNELRRQPVAAWYREALTVLREHVPELSGRLLVVALALCDRRVGRPMVEAGLFSCVLQDIREGFEIFGALGKSCLQLIPRSLIGSPIEPIVLLRRGCFGRRGALSPDGTRAVGYDERGAGEIALWNVESGRLITRLKPPGTPEKAGARGSPLRMVRFTTDGQHLRGLFRNGEIIQWSLADGTSRSLTGPIEGVISGGLSLDATTACVRLSRAAFVVIDVDSGAQLEVPTSRPLTRICISADGRRIVAVSGKSGVICDRREGDFDFDQTQFQPGQDEVNAVECTTDTVVGAVGHRLFVKRPDDDEPQLGPSAGRVSIVPDGSLAAYAVPTPGSVGLVQPRTNVMLGELPDISDAVWSTFSLNGRRLLTTHRDESMRVWDVGVEPSSSRLPPAAFDSDSADDTPDLLDRSRDVEAFASLIAARSVRPPLSIGIYADWGGGKSWFMQQLRRRVAARAADARASGVRQADVSWYKHIAQVQFNAWHYSETDVMASLVDHIITQLDVGEPVDAMTARRQAAQKAVADASDAEKQAADKLASDEAELAKLQEKREVLERKRADEADRLRLRLTREGALGDTISHATAALGQVGWQSVPGAVDELITTLRQARAQLAASRTLLTPLITGDDEERKSQQRWTLALGLAGPVLGLVVGIVWAFLGDEARAALAGAGTLVAGCAVGLTAIIGRNTKWVRERMNELSRAEQEIEKAIDSQLEGVDKALDSARKQESTKRGEVLTSRQEHEEKVTELTDKEKELAEARPEKELDRLVSSRVRSAEYSSRLGLVARARRDFEDVSDYINAINTGLDRPSAGLADEEDIEVSRIVLYIDDLDRCEPDKVAQVLQAVHLLLAFPLFVVVVGVDPRWVGRALKKHFPDLLGGPNADPKKPADQKEYSGADPNEYLEKIFQIPFWLEQLDDPTTKSMLAGLTSGRLTVPLKKSHPAGEGDEGEPEEPPPTSQTEGAQQDVHAEEASPTGSSASRSRELNPAGLLLEEHEVRAMQDLAPLLGRSPRAVKRFVNIYRLLKVRAEDPAEFAHKDRPEADYLIVLYLLAEITGRPDKARELFKKIMSSPDSAEVPDAPHRWPRTAKPYKAWVDDVARFSFTLLAPSVESSAPDQGRSLPADAGRRSGSAMSGGADPGSASA